MLAGIMENTQLYYVVYFRLYDLIYDSSQKRLHRGNLWGVTSYL